MILRVLGRLILLLALALTTGCQGVLFATLGAAGNSRAVNPQRDIVFDRDHRLALDVYRPTRADAAPVVVFFYGGTWESGKRQWYRYVGEALAKNGVVAIVPDYRKYPQVRFPVFVEDAARAVAWARDHVAQFGGDPRRIFLMGHSAGAHIAAMLATDARYLAAVGMQPRDLAGFIGLAGPYDFAPIDDADIVPIFSGDPAMQRAAMPVNFVDGDEPPMLLLHGSRDHEVQPRESKSLAQRMLDAGEHAEFKLYPGIGHSKILLSLSPLFPTWAPVLQDTLRFIADPSKD